MNVRRLVASWDCVLALLVFVFIFFILPQRIPNNFSKELYGVAISVLSILFAVFFAAMAVIISSSDDEFVKFLAENGDYDKLLDTFRSTLWLLFIALLASLALFCYSSYNSALGANQTKWLLTVGGFLFLYSLLASLLGALDAVTYAKFRARFLRAEPPERAGCKSGIGPTVGQKYRGQR